MKKGQNTRGYERYMALDIHRENIRPGDIVVLETTTNVWTIYDIVAPLASRVLVANAAEVGEIANARVKTDKEDIKRLLKLLIGGIVPEVWVPLVEVRELRAFVSYRHRLVKTSTTPALAVRCKCDPQSSAESAA